VFDPSRTGPRQLAQGLKPAQRFSRFLPAYFRARYLVAVVRLFSSRASTFSLNFIETAFSAFRTILENDLSHVPAQQRARHPLLCQAARARRPGSFLLFKDRKKLDHPPHASHELSAQFSEGFCARCMGLPTHSTGTDRLTCEKPRCAQTPPRSAS